MRFYLKLALSNVRKSARDYSVYFVTLGFAACLLYAFTASTDYLHAMPLTPEQSRVLDVSIADALKAFSLFTIVVFIFLVRYANRFILRRRKREFALYELVGMESRGIAAVLVFESMMVGALALAAGVAAGVLLSPAFGAAAAFVFDVPWSFVLAFFPSAAAWTAGSFAVVFVLGAGASVRELKKHQLVDLMQADRTPERPPQVGTRPARIAQTALAFVLLAAVWGTCVVQPLYFIAYILPMGAAACLATYLAVRLGAVRFGARARKRVQRYWDGLAPFTVRQIEARLSSSAAAISCVCVLVAVAVCMIAAGFVFSVGLHNGAADIQGMAATMAPIGYIGIFYGVAFLLSAMAVLALQQLAGAADARRAYETLRQIGCDRSLMRASMRSQIRLYFAAPLAGACVHDVFGLALVAYLSWALGSVGFGSIVAATALGILALMLAYYLLTVRACENMLLAGQ